MLDLGKKNDDDEPGDPRRYGARGQNMSGRETSHDAVLDYCLGCNEKLLLSLLDQGNGFCPTCLPSRFGGGHMPPLDSIVNDL